MDQRIDEFQGDLHDEVIKVINDNPEQLDIDPPQFISSSTVTSNEGVQDTFFRVISSSQGGQVGWIKKYNNTTSPVTLHSQTEWIKKETVLRFRLVDDSVHGIDDDNITIKVTLTPSGSPGEHTLGKGRYLRLFYRFYANPTKWTSSSGIAGLETFNGIKKNNTDYLDSINLSSSNFSDVWGVLSNEEYGGTNHLHFDSSFQEAPRLQKVHYKDLTPGHDVTFKGTVAMNNNVTRYNDGVRVIRVVFPWGDNGSFQDITPFIDSKEERLRDIPSGGNIKVKVEVEESTKARITPTNCHVIQKFIDPGYEGIQAENSNYREWISGYSYD